MANVFDLFAKITIDTEDYEKGLGNASEKTNTFSKNLKSGLVTAAKVGAAAITAAAGAVTALTKASIDQYSEYEQLVGGVETLFKQSSDVVQENAANAYKTAGMSANEYMETVTSFSASLLQSLGNDTEAAAKKADLAITDMADNSNKMGTSMEMLQNAYQGFAKQNFTMLDNLKLGYGGTKEEMERLLEDASKLSGIEYDISSYSDIVDAIHVVQTEMGITGTTAKEASSTIQGSISSMKAAWTNLVTGIADENANLDVLINNFVDSVSVAGENVIPRIEQILSGMGEAVVKLAPVISESVPGLVTNVLPSLLNAGVQLIDGLLQGLISALPAFADSAVSIIETFAVTIIEQLPALAQSAAEIIVALANGISDSLPELLPTIVDVVVQIVETLIDNVDALVDAAVAIIIALAEGLINALPQLIAKAPEIIASLVQAIIANEPKLLDAAVEIIRMLANGIAGKLGELLAKGQEIVTNIKNGISAKFSELEQAGIDAVNKVKNGIKSKVEEAKKWGKDLIDNFVSGIKGAIGKVTGAVSSVASTVKSILGFSEPEEGPLSDFHTYAPDMMQLFAEGIMQNIGLIKNAASSVASVLKEVFTGRSSIAVSSGTNWAEKVGQYVAIDLANGIEQESTEAEQAADKIRENIYTGLTEWASKQAKYEELTLKEQLAMWQAIQGQFEKGTKQYQKAEEKVFDLRKSVQDEYYDKVEEITQKISDLEQDYKDELEKTTSSILKSYDLFDSVGERYSINNQEFIDNIRGQIDVITEFYEGLDELSARGVSEGLVSEIRDMGPDAINQLNSILSMTDEKLTEYSQLYEEKQALANSLAIEQLADFRDETTAQIADNMRELHALYDEYAPEVGLSFTDGLAQGIMDGMSTVINSAVKVAQSAVDAVKSTLGIHSPSRVFAAIGENMALGLSGGWSDQYDSVKKNIVSGLNFGTASVDFASSGLGVSSAGIVNGVSSVAASGSGSSNPITINLMLQDGTKMASYLLGPLASYAKANGTPILNPT